MLSVRVLCCRCRAWFVALRRIELLVPLGIGCHVIRRQYSNAFLSTTAHHADFTAKSSPQSRHYRTYNMIIQKHSAKYKRARPGRVVIPPESPLEFERPDDAMTREVVKSFSQRVVVAAVLAILSFSTSTPVFAIDNHLSALPSSTESSIPTTTDDPVKTANAGRLLMTNDVTRKRSVAVEVMKQASMQDQRLSQCEGSGEDWEQCFFYGTQAMFTTPPPQDEATRAYPQWLTPQPHGSIPSISTKSRIPTW